MYQLFPLFLASTGILVGVSVACFIVALALGLAIGIFIYKHITAKKVGETKTVVAKMIEDAENEAKTIKKEAILEAKEQDLKIRNEFERESREKKQELQKTENRLIQKEETLDKKEEALNKKNDAVDQHAKRLVEKEADIAKLQEQVARQHDLMVQEIEKVAQLTKEEAKQQLIEAITEDARKDAAITVRTIEQEAKDDAEKKARNIISLAIQKCASDHASETTVSVVPLPSDDMKARIIGREGRNIKQYLPRLPRHFGDIDELCRFSRH